MRFLIVLIAAHAALGQVTSGSIAGYVLDPDQKPIAGARVVVADSRRALERSVETGRSGFYLVLDLPPAVYRVTASPENFAPASVEQVRVEVNTRLRVDLHPVLAPRSESIAVRAGVGALSTESSELGAVIGQERIEDLPLNKRDFLQLALLTPGVLPPVQGSALSIRGNFAMHANGGREEFNNFLLDGVDNNDPLINRYTLEPPVDAIQEFKIAANSYSAEYGRSAAGQVNVITRSGSDEFHGSLYEYLRNRVLDARNFFDPREKPKYVRNEFGGGAGGPILRQRTFFFANADGLSQRQGLSQLGTVPTALERSGDLSRLGATVTDPFSGQPFPGNRIPTNRISPIAVKVLDLFPLPNLPGAGGNYLGQPVASSAEAQFNARVDHRLTPVDQLTLRYSWGKKDLFEPYAQSGSGLPGFGDGVHDRGHNAMVHHTHSFSSRAVNSVLLGYNRAIRQVLPQNHDTDVNKLWGVGYLPTRALDFGFPSITVAGFSTVGDATSIPIDRTENTYQLTDSLSIVRGRHGLKAGGEFRKLEHNGALDVFARGRLIFPGALSGSGISDLLLGLPTVAIHSTFNNQQTLRSTASHFYVQDDWKLRPDLTLNLGLRYEYNTPPTDPANRMSIFDLAARQLYQAGTHGLSRSGIQRDGNNFAPRLGFAWTPAQDFVVRAGYGIFYDAGMFNVNSSLYFNPPFFNISTYFPSRTSLPTLQNPFPAAAGVVPPPQVSTLSPDLTTAYLQDWNLNLQRDFHRTGVLSVAYAGSKGTHLVRSLDLNQPPPGPGPLQVRVPYPGFSNIFLAGSGGNSEFQSFQMTFNRPLARGLSLWAVYLLAKSIDDTSAFLATPADRNFPQDSHNYRAERGLSSFDIHQRATAAGVYRLPGRSWLLRSTEIRSILTLQGGQPFTPVLRFDNSNTGNTGGNVGSDRPNLTGNPQLSNPAPEMWFNTAVFQIPPRYTFGNAGRNIVRGPGLGSWDLSAVRRFRISEWGTLLFEAQAFNLLNRANFDLPQLYADEPATFGRIFSAKAPRQIQFALRFAF